LIIFEIIIIVFILEVSIQIFIRFYKTKFRWFVNNEDEIPKFDEKKFKNFLLKSFDYKLGWKQTLDTSGLLNKNVKKQTWFDHRNIINKKKKKIIAAFGDSYVFSNYMSDKNTWEEQISKKNNFNVLNFGVGNYGLDQAILKYKNINLSKETKIVIMGFVPETITRIQSSWKHYTEFGNINGFKPKFELVGNNLILKQNPINLKTKIYQIEKIIYRLKQTERFYKERFLKYKFHFPYLVKFIINFKFNVKIFSYLIASDLAKILNKSQLFDKIQNSIFYSIIERNVKEAHYLYQENHSKKLLTKLIIKFKKISYKRKHIPLVIIFPQPQDINLKSSIYYKKYFKNLSKIIEVLDLSNFFSKKNYKKYFLNDKYGGHLNKRGNVFVSEIITNHLEKHLRKI
jgi:hypothetical protein